MSQKLTKSYINVPEKRPFSDKSIGQRFNEVANQNPDKEMYVFYADKERKTFRQMQEESQQFAGGLLKLGLKKGDTLGIWGGNHYEWLLAYLASLQIGVITVITPAKLPVVDIITSTESACRKLPPGEAGELRAKVVNLVTRPNCNKIDSNLSKEEREALQQLQKDQSIQILPADKGRLVVILNSEEYNRKCEKLVSDTNTYKNLGKKDPTSKYKKQLTSVLLEIEKEGGINRVEYRQLYPTTETPPKFYGLPKIHKKDTPLRPIVSSVGSITYSSAKLVADILAPLVGKTEHHVANSQIFAERIKNETVEEDEELRSYDVTALFTSVPVDKALRIIQHKLGVIQTLHHRADSIISEQEDIAEEKSHINSALKKCGYPNWSFDKAKKAKEGKSKNSNLKITNVETKGQVVLPYVKGTSEALRRIFGTYGIRVCFKPTQTLRQLLVSPKDKTEKKDITGPIYYIPCQGKTLQGQCSESYIAMFGDYALRFSVLGCDFQLK
ncbi:uncharacterized protein [Amphiura filiformis]|uniref:uncharacterized protein n=1 Tax=Amphiura filiformis TaxID=82378 RepID=UPI003B20C5AD